MRYEKILRVPQHTADTLQDICDAPNSGVERFGVTFSESVDFADGFRMTIKVFGPSDPTTETSWVRGVLYDPGGNEVGCTGEKYTFLGEYVVRRHDRQYVVIVTAETDTHPEDEDDSPSMSPEEFQKKLDSMPRHWHIPRNDNDVDFLSLLQGFKQYVDDGNVVEVRPCGFVQELDDAIRRHTAYLDDLAADTAEEDDYADDDEGEEYMVVHTSTGETVRDGFSTDMDAYTWLKEVCSKGEIEPADSNEYAVELFEDED